MSAKALCVLGMHRSGTSAITGVLQLLGVTLGDKLLKPHIGVNELGYFEHGEIVDIHDRMLAVLGSRWDDVRPLEDVWWESALVEPVRARLLAVVRRDFAAAALWGLKDPRMCRLLPMWFPVFEAVGATPCFLHMLRAPSEVAASLAKRDRFATEKSCCLWLAHNLGAERMTRGGRRTFVCFEHLLSEPRETLAAASGALGLDWPVALDDAIDRIQGFLSPQLRHHVEPENETSAKGDWEMLADRAYGSLAALRDRPDDHQAVDALHEEFARRVASFDPALVDHLTQEARARAEAEARLRQMRTSASWTLTKPVRFVQRLVGQE